MVTPGADLPLALVAGLVGVVGLVGAARAMARRDRDGAVLEAVCAAMGLAMVGMFEPRWDVVPAPVGVALFGAAGLWALARWLPRRADGPATVGAGHAAIHATMCAAMVYMYTVAMPAAMGSGAGSMAAMMPMSSAPAANASVARPVVTLALALALVVVATWRGVTRLSGLDATRTSDGPGAMSARAAHDPLELVTATAMGLVMAYALIASL